MHAGMHVSLCSVLFSPDPAHSIVPPTAWMVLPTSTLLRQSQTGMPTNQLNQDHFSWRLSS